MEDEWRQGLTVQLKLVLKLICSPGQPRPEVLPASTSWYSTMADLFAYS